MTDEHGQPAGKPTPRLGDAGSRSRTTPHQQARRDRGAETRERLIEAALDVFGRQGFEGATTRQIAKAAGANLAAIVYHFGSKEALHLAVAQHIVAAIRTRVGTTLAAAADPGSFATPAAARAMLLRLIETYISVILGSAEAERWARFLIREQMQPTAAFDILYDYMGGSLAIGTRLVAVILDRDPDDEEVKLRTLAMFGQIIVFRVAQALVLRRLDWRQIGDSERAAISRVVISQILAILDREAPP